MTAASRCEPEEGLRPVVRAVAQVVLGGALVVAGVSHLTFARDDFRAQVPSWVPLDADPVVIVSGLVEIVLGGALLTTWKQPRRALLGLVAGGFFVAVFPGNVAQLTGHRDAFGLDTDAKRAIRLLFQPVLIAVALGATDAWRCPPWRR